MLQLLFSFQGRLNRLQFFALVSAHGVVLLVSCVLLLVVGAAQHNFISLVLLLPIAVASIWVWLAITYKRMADIGIPPGLRRLMYFGVGLVGGAIGLTSGDQFPLLILAIRSIPLLLMLFWPGQAGVDEDQALGMTPPSPDPFPSVPMQPASPARKAAPKAQAWAPPTAAPAPARSLDGAPVFGRRGL